MVRKRPPLRYRDTHQPTIRLLELAHTVCIMHGLYVATIRQHGQVMDGIPKSLRAGYFFSGTIGPVVQVSVTVCLHTSIISTRTDIFRPFSQLELPNALTNHIWRLFSGF
jgi:hypothetical protein